MSLIKFNKISADTNGNNADQVQILQDDEFQDRVSSANLRSPDTYKTPFGEIPIEKCTKIHVGVLLAFAIVMIYAMLTTHYLVPFSHFFHLFMNAMVVRQVLTIIGCVLMIVALKKRRPLLYLPFLIANAIWILLATLFVLKTIGRVLLQSEIYSMNTRQVLRTVVFTFEQMLFYGYMEVVFF